MIDTQTDETTEKLHWIGSTDNDHIAIFVQGFGVKYDSKGLFTHLADALNLTKISSVLFNLSDYDEDENATFLSLSQQQRRILNVVSQIQTINKTAKLSFIGHSMGTGVLSTIIDKLTIHKAIMLAPARDNPGPLIYKGMTKHYQAQEKDGLISFPRKNGTISTFSKQYVKEFDIKFSDFYELNWPQITDLKVILADADCNHYTQDQLSLFKAMKGLIIEDCDHNFSNHKRDELTKLVIDFLKIEEK